MMITSGFAQVTGARLYFEIQGSGPTVVLLTDGPENIDSHFDALAESFQVIRYDMRGTGNSSAVGEFPFSYQQDLLELMDHLSIEKAMLAEITPGTTIADEFAEDFPERISNVIPAEPLLHSTFENDRSIR